MTNYALKLQSRAEPERRRLAASFQLNLGNVTESVCPHCRRRSAGADMALNLTIGPLLDGFRLLLVRGDADLNTAIDEIKRTIIEGALRDTQGNKARAARRLGIKYTTFNALVTRLGIEPARLKGPASRRRTE